MSERTVLVAAGVIIDGCKVLLTQRMPGAHLEGTWEFPGGKVEPGEAPEEALVREEKVTLSDFGTFTVSKRRGFKGHNPKSGTSMAVPERRIPVFRAGKKLKKSLNPE